MAAILVRTGGKDSLHYVMTDRQGSMMASVLTAVDGEMTADQAITRYSYDCYGHRRSYTGWDLTTQDVRSKFDRGFCMHEHLSEFGLIDMDGRVYNPYLNQFISPDPHIQDPTRWLNFNRYAYGLQNPVMYNDPTGELVWFIPVAIGAAIGAASGAAIAHNNGAHGFGQWAGYIGCGAVIGGAAGLAGAGVVSAGGSAVLAGTSSGFVGGIGFSGLASNWDASQMLKGAIIGTIAGCAGGAVSSAIGGGLGAAAGGATSNATSQLLSSGRIDGWSTIASAALSFGTYHAAQYANYKMAGGKIGGKNGMKITYRQFSKINTAYQRARFWRREFNVTLNRDGSARIGKWSSAHKYSTDIHYRRGDFASAHIHWAKAGISLVDPSGGDNPSVKYDPYNPVHAGKNQAVTWEGYHDELDIDASFIKDSNGDVVAKYNTFVIGRTISSYYNPSQMGDTGCLINHNDYYQRYFPFSSIYGF